MRMSLFIQFFLSAGQPSNSNEGCGTMALRNARAPKQTCEVAGTGTPATHHADVLPTGIRNKGSSYH